MTNFVVRIPGPSEKRKFSVMKFNGSLNVEVNRWTNNDCNVTMAREDNRAQLGILEEAQEFGEGSEYGKAAREEARRKKYGRQKKAYQHDMQPWRLTVGEAGKDRKFRSIREGGAGEHADYWVFLKSGEDFLAHKITDWYQFLPCVTHRTLDIDQAEEQFQLRSRVMNQFALKAQIMKTLNSTDDDGEQIVKSVSLKIKDDYSSDDEDSDGGNANADTPSKKKKKRNVRERNDKKQRVKHADDVAAYESEDGEDEGREYDYMSDSGSDSDRDTKTAEEKIEEALVAVGDESGLKKQIGSDLESSSDEEENDKGNKVDKEEDGEEDEGTPKKKKKNPVTEDQNNSSGSDSDDPDKDRINSVVFMKKDTAVISELSPVVPSCSKKRQLDDTSFDSSVKRSRMDEAETGASAATNEQVGNGRGMSRSLPQQSPSLDSVNDGLNEDTVRKYLRRKPHTTKELLTRIKSKCPPEMSKAQVVTHLASILKKIEPHQFKQKQGKKEVLFFSLANTAK